MQVQKDEERRGLNVRAVIAFFQKKNNGLPSGVERQDFVGDPRPPKILFDQERVPRIVLDQKDRYGLLMVHVFASSSYGITQGRCADAPC